MKIVVLPLPPSHLSPPRISRRRRFLHFLPKEMLDYFHDRLHLKIFLTVETVSELDDYAVIAYVDVALPLPYPLPHPIMVWEVKSDENR